MLIGVSAQIKDKRVNRIIRKLGYEEASCEIFYSPVKVWMFCWGILLGTLIPISFYFLQLAYLYPLSFFLYFLLGYLIVAYLNNTFVIVQGKILVINPNVPFQRVVSYDFDQIKGLKIDTSKQLWLTWMFAHFGNNYVEIITKHQSKRFYCTFLEVDAFDENFTEKTMDDFHGALKKRNIPTEFNLYY